MFGRKTDRERRRNTRHVYTDNSLQRLSESNQTIIQDGQRSEDYSNQHSKVWRSTFESMPFELTLVRRKDKQAQMMVADLSPPMPVENLQLKLKHKINIKGNLIIRGCSFLPDGIMLLSCYNDCQLFQQRRRKNIPDR
jgi:hypothetical protein